MEWFQDIVWMNDPTSPVAIALFAVAAATLGAYAWSFVKVAGPKAGLTLVGLRGLAIAILALILLQPAKVVTETYRGELPVSFTHKEIRLFGTQERDRLLPPLQVLSPPGSQRSKDVVLESARGVPLAYFKGTCPVVLTVDNGDESQSGEVTIRKLTSETSKEVVRKRVTLKEGKQQIHLELVPDEVGKMAYSVHLEGFSTNESTKNDTAVFSLVVARESLRVLHIAGHPSWDVRFLRQFLTSLPGIELISFYLLVQAEDFAPHSREELALIPFPTDELFIKEIGNFDIIIVHNFPLGTYFLLKEEHLKHMAQFVQEGGALFFLGGDLAYQMGALETTPVANILPVELASISANERYIDGPFAAETATEGLTHPVTTLQGPEGERMLGEQDLPLLSAVNQVGAVKDNGVALLWAQNAENRVPLLVAGQAGRGRVLLLATDSLWRWAFPPEPSAVAPSVYRELLWNSLAWLSRDPRMEGIRLETERLPVESGKEFTIEACPTGASVGASLTAEATWSDALGNEPGFKVAITSKIEESGCSRFKLPGARPGAWKLSAFLDLASGEIRGTSTIAVERRRKPKTERIREAITALTDVALFPFLLDPVFEFDLQPNFLSWEKPTLVPVWNHPLWFLAFALLVLMEWILRKLWGYL